jgi:UDP-glucose 4-epimerase
MRILVTGVSGFAGSFIARHLARTGYDVVGTYRRRTSFLAAAEGQSNIRFRAGDLATVDASDGPFDAIIHIAASSPAPGTGDSQIVRDNLRSTLRLLDAAAGWDCRAFVLFSSMSLYGEVQAAVVDESSPIINPDVYGATKYIAECLVAERAPGLSGLALRLPGIIGPGAHRNWLSQVAATLLGGQPVKAFNLDAQFNNAVHVADLANMVEENLKRSWRGFEAVTLGAGSCMPVRSVIERLAVALGTSAQIEVAAPRKSPFILSSQRAVSRWHYAPMKIEDMLDRYGREVRGGLRE